jgi:hypothetical protein
MLTAAEYTVARSTVALMAVDIRYQRPQVGGAGSPALCNLHTYIHILSNTIWSAIPAYAACLYELGCQGAAAVLGSSAACARLRPPAVIQQLS